MALTLANLLPFIAIFLILQPITASDSLSPRHSPNFEDEICKEVECGKGTCNASVNYDFGYICQCETGWRQNHVNTSDHEDYRFLPCVIPNCTLNYSCTDAPPPTPDIDDSPMNKSFFDPCYWSYCGEGTCTKSLRYGYKCKCNEGYSNLLNITAFPCYSKCVLGSDCASLGITVSNDSSTSTSLPKSGSSVPTGSFLWLTILIMSLAIVSLK
ncbi:hypothetical protein GIB67_040916 [Kingdonia uniflora]|uniref:Uncharacterized protein n=1 Tax=Kingdonia uniflora TaxID=39325 RepID=A0A7J7PD34_9MAGN|nr:hypothetical protein GIB67_040916 [Kingdonia uniflora]